MKNTLPKYFSIACSLLMLIGCDDYLEEQPESTLGIDDFYSTTVEAEIALAGIYSVFATNEVYGNAMSIIMESGTDEGYYNRRFNENWTVGLYRHTTADIYVQDLWSNLYQAINLSNLFIEQLVEANFEPAEYNALIAEARFLRAHAFQLLVSWYEEVPMPLNSTKDQSDNDLPVSSLEELYTQIESDLVYAAENLPSVNSPNYILGRATDMAARGLLARAYLKMGGYPLKDASKFVLAREQCGIIIDSGLYTLNASTTTAEVDEDGNDEIVVLQDGYRNHFLSYIQNTYDPQESLFEISFKYLRDSGLNVDGRIGATNGIPFSFGGGADGFPFAFGGFNTTSILKELYDADNDSIRKAWNIPGFQYNGNGDAIAVTNQLSRSFVPGKYRRWEPADFSDLAPDASPAEGSQEAYILLEGNSRPNRNFTGINFPVLRYADILLMYAEADNEVSGGPSARAVQYLDQVRERAGVVPIATARPSVVASKNAFFDELVDERLRELCFEGLRKFDLIRWELLDDKLQLLQERILGDPDYSPTNADHQAFLRPSQFFDSSKHLSLPYPLQEVNLNNSLDQKSEW